MNEPETAFSGEDPDIGMDFFMPLSAKEISCISITGMI